MYRIVYIFEKLYTKIYRTVYIFENLCTLDINDCVNSLRNCEH